jgi:hypothetical protein
MAELGYSPSEKCYAKLISFKKVSLNEIDKELIPKTLKENFSKKDQKSWKVIMRSHSNAADKVGVLEKMKLAGVQPCLETWFDLIDSMSHYDNKNKVCSSPIFPLPII